MADYLIRAAQVSDAQAILLYLKQVGSESDQLSFGEEGNELDLEEERAYLKKIKESEYSTIFLCCLNEEIISLFYVMQKEKQRFKHIAEISCSVKKAYWNQGIASMLMKHTINYAKNTGFIRILELEVLTHNESAIALYKKFGFEVYGTFEKRMHLNGCDYDSYFMNLYL